MSVRGLLHASVVAVLCSDSSNAGRPAGWSSGGQPDAPRSCCCRCRASPRRHAGRCDHCCSSGDARSRSLQLQQQQQQRRLMAARRAGGLLAALLLAAAAAAAAADDAQPATDVRAAATNCILNYGPQGCQSLDGCTANGVPNCAQCQRPPGQAAFSCTICQPAFFLGSDGQCRQCPWGAYCAGAATIWWCDAGGGRREGLTTGALGQWAPSQCASEWAARRRAACCARAVAANGRHARPALPRGPRRCQPAYQATPWSAAAACAARRAPPSPPSAQAPARPAPPARAPTRSRRRRRACPSRPRPARPTACPRRPRACAAPASPCTPTPTPTCLAPR